MDTDDHICVDCVRDAALAQLVTQRGEDGECAVCHEERVGISIQGLAEIIDPVFRENFQLGRFTRQVGRGDDDTLYDVQEGEDLNFSLQVILGSAIEYDDDLYDAIISGLENTDPYDPRDGGEPFYDRSINYEETTATAHGPTLEWEEISTEVKTRRRFFSDRAKQFFDDLFANVEQLSGHLPADDREPRPGTRANVVQTWATGTTLYRARRAERDGDAELFISEAATRLTPPPEGTARAGRMNAEGVSVFYGALDEETCLAELRSSIGSTMVVGKFLTRAALQIIDLRLLERAWGHQPLSYFQADFQRQVERREFLRRIHRLISQPVVPGHEADYLITQVLAEYLAHVRRPRFDGVVFASTQREGGANVVLFPPPDGRDAELITDFPVEHAEGAVTVYRTTGIEYTNKKLRFVERDNGEIVLYGGHEGYDDD